MEQVKKEELKKALLAMCKARLRKSQVIGMEGENIDLLLPVLREFEKENPSYSVISVRGNAWICRRQDKDRLCRERGWSAI